MKTYKGTRPDGARPVVRVFQEATSGPLDAHTELWWFGDHEFDWAQEESPGQRQLALAILVDATDDTDVALFLAEAFADSVLRQMTEDRLEISELVILRWVVEQLADALHGAQYSPGERG